jgi:hypothetical protein
MKQAFFVSGWRPAAGWVFVGACAWLWVGQPIALLVAAAFHQQLQPLPAQPIELLMGLLGVAGLRTYEKLRGIARSTIEEKS